MDRLQILGGGRTRTIIPNVINQEQRTAAITGAGSGLGCDIALGLAAKGYCVFGTAMSPEEIADLKKASGGAVTLSVCDITDEAAVKSWALEVAARSERGLDLLISNAGILTPGPLELDSHCRAGDREFRPAGPRRSRK